uniref:uncharacterized protein LOC122591304 isoform X3 n=1 Tax=Erigeron canadensis TaxID=72917 RepID=UPI001CB88C4D|nr:uncharacterized protein LOC122591304 isoform X3 [Erigeron canadensis]
MFARFSTHMVLTGVNMERLMKGVVGNGSNMLFWKDWWIGKDRLMEIYTQLYSLEKRKACLVSDRICNIGSSILIKWEWHRKLVSPLELSALNQLTAHLSFTDPGPHGSGRYSEHMLLEVEMKLFIKDAQLHDPNGIANLSVTHVDWCEQKWHPKSYEKKDITVLLPYSKYTDLMNLTHFGCITLAVYYSKVFKLHANKRTELASDKLKIVC